MHLMHPNYCLITIILCTCTYSTFVCAQYVQTSCTCWPLPTLSSSTYPMMTHPPPVAGNLPTMYKTLVARKLPTNMYVDCRSTTCWTRTTIGLLMSLVWKTTSGRLGSTVIPGSWLSSTLETQQVIRGIMMFETHYNVNFFSPYNKRSVPAHEECYGHHKLLSWWGAHAIHRWGDPIMFYLY